MKTTVNIANTLLHRAKRLAVKEKTTLRALIEEGLRRVLERRERHDGFRLRRASFRGNGLQPDAREGGWDRVRELTYEGRGT